MNGENPPPYTQWGLPPGAKARLGKGGLEEVRYSPDGAQLAITGLIGIWLYDAYTCKEIAFLQHGQDRGTTLPSSWTGTTLFTQNWDETISITLWDTQTGQRQITLDGKILASAGWDNTIRLWNPQNCEHISTFTVPDNLYALAFSRDGNILAGGGEDDKVRLWDSHSGNLRAVLNGHYADVEALVFSPDRRTLASGGDDGTILLWDLDTVGNTYR